MSGPYVNSYDDKFMDAFGRGITSIPDDKANTIKDMVEKIHEEVISKIEYYVIDELKSNLDDQIRQEAASVASSMLANAIAGDDKEIRNLFGFSEYYMQYAHDFNNLPKQWALIDALVVRRPDLFVDERIAQRDREIVALKHEMKRLREYMEFRRRQCEGESS